VGSELGRGSAFSIAIPSVNHIALGTAASAAAGAAFAAQDERRPALAGLQLLLVDDDASIHEALRPEMRRSGVTMTSARSPEQVCALFAATPPPAFDFALVDRDLGGEMSGVELLDHLASRFGVAVPALIMTGASDPKVLRELRDSDYPYVRKPVSLAVVTEWIERLRRDPALSAAMPSPP
jgi:DNA-binding NtrC family response regulator